MAALGVQACAPVAAPEPWPHPAALASPWMETCSEGEDFEAASPTLRGAFEALAAGYYPAAEPLLREPSDAQLVEWTRASDDELAAYVSGATVTKIVDGFATAAHEGAHLWTWRHEEAGTSYLLRPGVEVVVSELHGFPSRRLLRFHPRPDKDLYADTYLADSLAEEDLSGLLDELNAYTHSLASRYCVRHRSRPDRAITARAAPLTFLFYVDLYLRRSRTHHPFLYRRIAASPETVHAIAMLHRRAAFWLEATRDAHTLNLYYEATLRWDGTAFCHDGSRSAWCPLRSSSRRYIWRSRSRCTAQLPLSMAPSSLPPRASAGTKK